MQQPAPGVSYAGNGARFIAFLIDAFIMVMIGGIILLVFGVIAGLGAANDNSSMVGLGGFAGVAGFLLVYLIYMPWFWGHGGQTPGMMICRLRVVRAADGGPVAMGKAYLRLVGFWISAAFLYIGFLLILFDARRQGWLDKIAGTVVIKVP